MYTSKHNEGIREWFTIDESNESSEEIEELNNEQNSFNDKNRKETDIVRNQDLSQEEIADTLNISVGTVKSRLSRARAHLRDLLTPLYREWQGKDTP